MRDAIIRIEDLIDRAIELGQEVVAFTEHETVSNAIKIEKYYNKIKKDNPNFKVIRGNEIYLCRNGLDEESYIKGEDEFYHYILLAKNARGHEQIREISTKAWSHSFKTGKMTRVPTWYQDLIDVIAKEQGNVIGSTACLGGNLPKQILKYYKEGLDEDFYQTKIIDWCTQMVKLFGEGNFYLELQPSNIEDQILVNKELIKISNQLGIPYIITCDSHYLTKQDAPVHKAFLNAQEGDREVDEFYSSTYLQSTEEVENYLKYLSKEELEQAYQNILDIKNKCEDYTLTRELKIPSLDWKEPTPITSDRIEFYKSKIPYMETFLKSDFNGDVQMIKLIINKFESDERLRNQQHYDAINENLKSVWISSEVNKTHWSAYFLNLQKTIEVCWNAGTLVGPGRGSGVGFVLLYFLDIIQINCLWEKTVCFPWRFLNPDRVSVLDIDTDIEGGRRSQVLQALREYYGEDKVANVVTFGTEKSKSAIQTACFKEGTLVETKNGEIPIELIQSGDLVKTLNGYEPVIFPTVYQSIPNYKIKTKNSLNKEFYCTADHEILTIEAYRRVSGKSCTSLVKEIFPELNSLSSLDNVYEKYMRNVKKVNPVWKPASQIRNKYDFGLTLIDTTIKDIKSIHWTNEFRQKFGIGISENVNINEDFCELIGIWLAEGSINKANNTVVFTIHQDEEFLKLRIIQLMWKVFQLDNVCITSRLDSKAITIVYSSSQLAQFFFELFDNTGIWKEKRADNTYHYLTQ